MALAVLDTVAAERAESHDDEDVRRIDRVKENRSAMERKWVEGRGDIVRRVGRLECEYVWRWYYGGGGVVRSVVGGRVMRIGV